MEFAKEVTGLRPGCRGRHALSAASFSRIKLMSRGKLSIGSCQRRCKLPHFGQTFRTLYNFRHLRIESTRLPFNSRQVGAVLSCVVTLLGPLTWPQVTQRSFWTKHESGNRTEASCRRAGERSRRSTANFLRLR